MRTGASPFDTKQPLIPFVPSKQFPTISISHINNLPDWALVQMMAGIDNPVSVSLRELAAMTAEEISNVLHVSRERAEMTLAALEAGRRMASSEVHHGSQFESPEKIVSWLKPLLQERKKECFYALSMDQKHRIIDCHLVSEGTLTMTLVHPREAFLPIVRDSAAAAIFIHNHPSGDTTPSGADDQLTDRLVECGVLLGIRVLDHIVIGREGFLSYRTSGRMKEPDNGKWSSGTTSQSVER